MAKVLIFTLPFNIKKIAMKIEAFLPVDQVEEMECQSAFISLARQLIIAGRMFFYDTPCYHNRDFGLSIVITYVDSRTYNLTLSGYYPEEN